MDVAFGLLGIVAWIVGVIALAAAITWVVIKITPGEKPAEAKREG